LSKQCGFLKPNGDRCRGTVREGDAFCWAHDVRYEEARRRGQARGGKSKPSRELVDIKQRLAELAQDVLNGNVDRSTGAVVSQILNVLLRAIATEIKVKEIEDLEVRIEQIEAAIERQQNKRWGRSSV
jgi:hypothetical protein